MSDYATPAQTAFIAKLAADKGMSRIEAMIDYGFAPGHILSVRDASDLIASLKGLTPEQVAAERAAYIAAHAEPVTTYKVGQRVVLGGRGGVVAGIATKRGKAVYKIKADDGLPCQIII